MCELSLIYTKLKFWKETCFSLITVKNRYRKLHFVEATVDTCRNPKPLITRSRITACVLIEGATNTDMPQDSAVVLGDFACWKDLL